MPLFEIHITGDESIHEAAKPIGLKTIAVDLVRPDLSVLRTEHMTSQAIKYVNVAKCLYHVGQFVSAIEKTGTEIKRIKVETPYGSAYTNRSLYIESHFIPKSSEATYPLSRNQNKTTLLATDRIYSKENFDKFAKLWENEIVELAIFDSFVEEDYDWFELYKEVKIMFIKTKAIYNEEKRELFYNVWIEDTLVLNKQIDIDVYEFLLNKVRDNDIVEIHSGNATALTWSGARFKEDVRWCLEFRKGIAKLEDRNIDGLVDFGKFSNNNINNWFDEEGIKVLNTIFTKEKSNESKKFLYETSGSSGINSFT